MTNLDGGLTFISPMVKDIEYFHIFIVFILLICLLLIYTSSRFQFLDFVYSTETAYQTKWENLTSSFLSLWFLLLVPHLLLKNCSIVLNKSEEHSCFLLDFRGNVLFFPFSIILATDVPYIIFILNTFFSITSFFNFFIMYRLDFVKKFVHIIVLHCINIFVVLNQHCKPGMKSASLQHKDMP